jgi:phosphoribosylamine--glycine ligase
MAEVIEPTIKGLAAEGMPYTGFLYAGLMIDAQGTPKVLEYNCRFGDPETQPIMMRLKSDLVELCLAATEKRLDSAHAEWDPRVALGVVMAAGGYPADYNKGDIISGLNSAENQADLKIFHAGTANDGENVVTAGGRVLCNVALGCDIKEAQDKAYMLTKNITWAKAYYRTDIGFKAIKS